MLSTGCLNSESYLVVLLYSHLLVYAQRGYAALGDLYSPRCHYHTMPQIIIVGQHLGITWQYLVHPGGLVLV
jgi:hypothetical protein